MHTRDEYSEYLEEDRHILSCDDDTYYRQQKPSISLLVMGLFSGLVKEMTWR